MFEFCKVIICAEKRQRAAKLKKRENLMKQKLVVTQHEYAHVVAYLDMFYLLAWWDTVNKCSKEFAKLGSKTVKLEAVKKTLRILMVGLGKNDLQHTWSTGSED